MFPSNSVILIVDDSSAIRTMINSHLESMEFGDVLEAANGKEALKQLEDHYNEGLKIGLAIVDWKMPEMDGLELLKFMKRHKKYKEIPFLMIAAEREADKMTLAVAEGAADFLFKPFNENQLLEKLEAMWERLK